MNPGECWYVEPALPHGAGNPGEDDRVHLVIDCVVNDFINTLVGFDIIEQRRSRADEYAREMELFRKEWESNVPQNTPNPARRLYYRGVRLLRRMNILG